MSSTSQSLPIDLPTRTARPRETGLTSLIDPGLPTRYFQDVVESHGPLIDCVKFGWGTALVTKDLREKIAVLKAHGVAFYFGGSLFEKALQKGQVEAYRSWCSAMGCEVVEISNGTLDISQADKARHIAEFARDFIVYSEVGYKDSERSINLPPSKWVEFIQGDLAAGARYAITEARESGTSGICRSNGELRFGLIEDVLAAPIDHSKLIFEAPNKTLQVFFIKKLGSNVNLGNIAFADIIGLETLRLGLRSDTLSLF